MGGEGELVAQVNLLTLYLNSAMGASYACTKTEPIWILKEDSKTNKPVPDFTLQLQYFQVRGEAGWRGEGRRSGSR